MPMLSGIAASTAREPAPPARRQPEREEPAPPHQETPRPRPAVPRPQRPPDAIPEPPPSHTPMGMTPNHSVRPKGGRGGLCLQPC
jgi:hypothetical protein